MAGLTLCRPVGRDVTARWRARDTATGHEVLLRPLPPGGAAGRVGSLPTHPHLLVPRVLPDEHGNELLVVRWATHGGLDRLMTRREGLLPGEASTLGHGLARALATLHADGQVHGAVTPSSVLLGEGLRPLLDTVPMLAPPPPGATAADDVAALGRLLLESSARPVPAALGSLLADATHPDPAQRPTAADLVRQLVATAPPEAVRLVLGPASALFGDPRPSAATRLWRRFTGASTRVRAAVARRDATPGGGRHRRRRAEVAPSGRWRVAVRAAATVSAVALAVVAGIVWAGLSAAGDGSASAGTVGTVGAVGAVSKPAAPTGPVPAVERAAASAGSDWARVVFELDRLRAEAFETADTGALEAVDAPGSPALASDRAALLRLSSVGASAVGYRSVLRSVRLLRSGPGAALVEVVDERPPYELVASDGRVLSRPAARGVRSWRVDLDRVDGRWLVHRVAAVP